jgi:hypothetical protein
MIQNCLFALNVRQDLEVGMVWNQPPTVHVSRKMFEIATKKTNGEAADAGDWMQSVYQVTSHTFLE